MNRLIAIGAALACAGGLRAADKVDFTKEIRPIFQQNCVKCHGPEKQKAKLRLDSKEAAMKGGEDGVVIVPSDAAKSDLYRRITLPKGHDDFMPHEGDPLTAAQTDLIRDWINQGATWPEEAAPKESVPTDPLAALPKDFKPGANEPKAIARIAQSGVDIRPVARNTPWTEANFRLQGTNVTDAVLASVKDVTSLVEVNLAKTSVTDAGLAALENLTNLIRLHLEMTSVTDAGLARLKNLVNLSYLNLYGTAVTDAGLERLKGLRSLKQLYLWQTKVTEAGASDLKKALPELMISTGAELETLVKKEEKPEEKKEEK